jgi:hypothetical protein
MSSTKRKAIVDSMMEANKNYADFIPKALEDYIKSKYKCSTYLARLCAQDLISKTNE